jgi:TolB-like protein
MTDGSAPLVPPEHMPVQGDTGPGPDGAPRATVDPDALHARKKRDKLRAAWISFIGRILAQLIGAAATILLGLYVVRTYGVGKVVEPGPVPQGATDVARPPTPHDHRSIAVLPLVSFAPGQADEALCAGLTEAVIAQLAQDRTLRVVSRTSSMAYRQSNKRLPAIAAELGVDLVLEGSVTRVGDRVRVTTQLVDASTDTHLWAATYDRSSADLLALEAELSRVIAEAVRAAVAEAPR